MKNDGWVRWSQWESGGMTNFGQMRVKDVDGHLRKFAKEAREVLQKTGADHVVYGLKRYDEDGDLEHVKFYMVPMNDEDFQKDVATLKGCTIYALHKGTAVTGRDNDRVRDAVLSYLGFEFSTSLSYPFKKTPEELTGQELEQIVMRCGGHDDTETVHDACMSVIGGTT